MKKFNLKLAATVMVCGAFLFSSCIGSFGLHSKLLSWNEGIGNKFVNELVYLAFNIIPVYGICYFGSMLWFINLLNSGAEATLLASIGEVKKVKGENGNYLVETLENGYSITKEGETASMELIYDKDLNTWNVVAEGVSTELLQINNDGTAQMTLPNGEDLTVTLDAQGVSAARQATMVNTYYAATLRVETRVKQKGCAMFVKNRAAFSFSDGYPLGIRMDILPQNEMQNRG